jgi:hypothetical protein
MMPRFSNIVNTIIDAHKNAEPVIGDGVTELCYTDRRAYTIIQIISNREIIIQKDKTRRLDPNGMSDCQHYEYSEDKTGETVAITKRNDNKWYVKTIPMRYSNRFIIGIRDKYHDFSF